MTIVHAGTQTKKIYQNEKLTIQLNPKLKVKKIEKSNKSFRIKKCGVNKYTICSADREKEWLRSIPIRIIIGIV